MATTYAYLVDPNKQYMTKSGTINVNGTLRVYDAATDDIVITYKDFNGTENEASIKLDNNGRAIVIADSARAYRLEVYDRYGSLQWTVSPLWCLAAGGGVNVHTTRVISTDGSIDVDQIDVGSTTTFDIGLAPNDSDEFLEWITCSEEDCGSTWYPVYQSGTMETEAGQGVKVHGGHLYHFTNSFTVDPNGSGINYDTFRVTMYCGDEIVDVRDFDIDSSVNDPVLCEFSRDVVPTEDTHVYFKLTIPSTCEVTAEVQCHRIYSGINAVPDSCATKPWVSEYFEEKSSMSAYIPFSGLDYNQSGSITGISGSAIYAALDSGTVSAIASSYAESAISSISGWSADFSSISSKVDQSAFEQCCDEVHSALDEKLDKSASSEFQPSGQYVYESAYSSFSSEVTNNISSLSSNVSGISADMSAYVPFSGLEYNGNGDISGISGSAIAGGLDSASVSSIASSYAESAISSISGWSGDFSSISSKIDWSSSGVFQPSGDYAYNSSLSSKADQSALDDKLDKSASGEFQPSGEYVYESAYSSFSSEVTNNISSISSTVSGLTGQYIEQSASSMFQPSGNYASASDLSAYVPFSGLEGEGGKVTGISGSAFKAHEYTGINPVTVDNTADTISVEHRTLCVDSTMTAYTTGDSAVIGVNVAGLDISSKMDASASSLFYSTSNPSGFIDGASASAIASAYQVVSATATQLNVGTAYLTSVNETPISAARAGNATNASLATSAWYDGTGRLISALPDEATVSSIASAYAESAASGKQDTSAMSSYALSADVSGVIDTVSSNSASWAGGITGDYLTSKVGSGQATFTTAFQDGMEKRPSLVISAQRSAGSSMYPRMMITDWNDTTGETHSGALLANAFEFYICPDSAMGEVAPSGIRQSRLDASHLWFNVNEAVSSFTRSAEYTRSSMRLGQSGNSANWVVISGNGSSGGLITLDDGSGTSGRIFASSIGYWNDKLDGSASSSFYTTANESGYVDSAYVESQVSSKQDTLTFDWDVDSAISSINGSALAGQGGAQVVTSITTGGYGVREINGMVINASHMVLGAEAAYNTSNVVKLGNSDYGAGVFLTGNFGSAYYKVNELQLNRNGIGFIGFNIGGAGSQITATSNAGGKFSAGGTGGNRSYFTAFNASASASIEVTGGTAMVNITDTGYTSTIYPSSIPYWNGKADSSALSSYVPYSSLEYNTASAISGINGSALAAGSKYSAGEGIDITDDVISVEAPVDIVAGPGIIIDNPDGNTLRVSQAYPTDETVLYQAATNEGTTLQLDQYVTLSESMTHFERVRIYYAVQKPWAGKGVFESYMVDGDLKVNLHDVWYREQSGFNVWYETFTYNKYTDSNLRFTQAGGVQRAILNTTWNTTSGLTTIVYKIVGVHRLVANN